MLLLSMSNYDMDTLLGTYADWVAWLREKEASLEGQLARMKGREKAPADEVEPVTDKVEPATVADEESIPDQDGNAEEDDWL